MNDTTSPVFVALLFILRCLVPLAILFGISYLLRKLGLVAVEAAEEPVENDKNGNGENGSPVSQEQTGPSQPTPSGTSANRNNTVGKSRSRSK